MSNIDRLAYNRNGQLFTAANVAAVSVVAVSTTATGLILYNPVGSNKQLAILDVGWAWDVAPAAVHQISLAIMTPNITVPTGLTAASVQSGQGSGNASTSIARAYSAATLPAAPVTHRILFGAVYGSGVGESPAMLIDFIDGALMVQPGGAACLAAIRTTAVGMGHICWIEV